MRLPLLYCVLALLSAIPPSAQADSVTYTYTGAGFNSFSGNTAFNGVGPGLTTSDFVAASFTLPAPLPDNLSGIDESSLVQGYSISDQVTTFSASGPGELFELPLIDLIFSTDASGNITAGSFQGLSAGIGCANCFGIGSDSSGSDYSEYMLNGRAVGEASGPSGTWAETPEPGPAYLLGFGLVLLFAIRLVLYRARAV